jgi:IclR family transcriptional regulator, KDG regulon repressor
MSPQDSQYRVQVLDRALLLLEILANHNGECALADIAKEASLHKSTVHRIISSLEQHRFVLRSVENGRYMLGLKLFELGTKAMGARFLREHARPHLSRVMFETGETVHLCIFDNGEVLYVDKIEPQKSVRMSSAVGLRSAAYCTAVGKAVLAHLGADEVSEIVRRFGMSRRTSRTITTTAELLAELDVVRRRGYAIDDEENEEGVRCIGAAVLDQSGRPVAAISVSGPAFSVTREKTKLLARPVVTAAHLLSTDLGFRDAAMAAEQ